MVKPGRNRKSSSCDNHEREFFKVYLPRLSSQQPVIPLAFVRHLNGDIPLDIILKDSTGRQRHYKLEEVERGIAITNGWNSFAIQHSLVQGDFLDFNYNRDSLFTAKIFGTNGRIKEGTFFPNLDINHVKKETEIEDRHTFDTADHAYEQKHSVNVLQRIKRSGSVDKRKTRKNAAYVVLKNLHFVTIIGSKYCVHVSGSVVRSHGIEVNPEMTLRDEKGKKWPVKIAFRKDGRISITRGWTDFFNKNSLKVGNQYVFEFVYTKGNICNEMKVQVLKRVR